MRVTSEQLWNISAGKKISTPDIFEVMHDFACPKELERKIQGSARANLKFSPQISIKLATMTRYVFSLQH